MRKSEELLKCGKTQGSASTDSVIFVAEKRLQRLISGLLQFFCCDRLCRSLPLGLQIALTVTARKPTEY